MANLKKFSPGRGGQALNGRGDAVNDETSWNNFAMKNFVGGVPAQFSRKDIKHPLLIATPDADKKAALSIWHILLRFMGDATDYRANMSSSHQPNLGSVMTRLCTELGITAADRDKSRLRLTTDNKPEPQISKSKEDILTEEDPDPEAVAHALGLTQGKRKKKGGTLRRLRATLTTKLFKEKTHPSVFQSLPLEESLRSPLEQVHFILGYGILKPTLRDEIYSQVVKQLTNNPYKSSVARGWLLLNLAASSFTPTELMLKPVTKFLEDGPPLYTIQVKKNLQRTIINGTRCQPPSFIEFEAALQKKLLEMSVTLMDGMMHTLSVDCATTARELCTLLSENIGLKDRFGFSLYISMYDKVASLGNGSDHIFDSVSQCEQIFREREGQEGGAPWRFFFRKEMFSPWESAVSDPVATSLVFSQVVRGIMLGEYTCDTDQQLAILVAQQYYIEYGCDISEDGLTALLPSYIPPDVLDDEEAIRKWRKWVVKAHHKLYGGTGQRPSPEKVKQEIVHLAKTKWAMAFSRYYDVRKVVGPDWPHQELSIAVNWTGVYVVGGGETLLEMAYPEIVRVSDGGGQSSSSHVIMFLLVNGGTFKFTSGDAEDVRHLVEFMLNGLKKRSTYAVAVQTYKDADRDEVSFREGDLLSLDRKSSKSQKLEGRNERSGESGSISMEHIYILPTLARPSEDVMRMFQTASFRAASR